jgi:hypothetical protein
VFDHRILARTGDMIVSLILEDIKRNNGVFPERNTFIEEE